MTTSPQYEEMERLLCTATELGMPGEAAAYFRSWGLNNTTTLQAVINMITSAIETLKEPKENRESKENKHVSKVASRTAEEEVNERIQVSRDDINERIRVVREEAEERVRVAEEALLIAREEANKRIQAAQEEALLIAREEANTRIQAAQEEANTRIQAAQQEALLIAREEANEKIQAVEEKANEKIQAVEEKANEKIQAVEEKANEKIQAVEEKANERIQVADARVRVAAENVVSLLTTALKAIYGTGHRNFTFPKFILNLGVGPSLTGKRVSGISIPKAEKIIIRQRQWLDTKYITIPVKTKNGLIPSILGALYESKGCELTYANEFDVQSYCWAMLNDVLSALGLGKKEVDSHLELSLYMMRPDIVIVLRRGGKVFFAVEVKSPSAEGQDDVIYGNKNLGGQIWSYLYAMKAAGLDNPIGAIMTFNTIAIVNLQDCTNDEQHIAHLRKTKTELSKEMVPDREGEPEKHTCTNRTDSPARKKVSYNDVNLEQSCNRRSKEDGEEVNPEKEVEMARTVYYSNVHHREKVFPFLLQAVSLAYQKVIDSGEETLCVLKNDDEIARRLAFKVGKSSYNWVALPLKKKKDDEIKLCATVESGSLPSTSTHYFYILNKIGEGGKSSVYLACSIGGQVCVIKDYNFKTSARGTQGERQTEDKETCAIVKKQAESEEQRWKNLYASRFCVRIQELGAKHCLLLPYGYEITDDADNRWKYIPAIRNELMRFAQWKRRAKAYFYKNSDLRWRHVLLDTNGNIFFCDLESLEEVSSATNNANDEIVYKQLQALLKPMIVDKSVDKTRLWMKDDSNIDELVTLITSTPTLKDFFAEQFGTTQYVHYAALAAEINATENAKNCVAVYMIDHYLRIPKRNRSTIRNSPRKRPRKC
jgi:Family of unknown function (DUF5898)